MWLVQSQSIRLPFLAWVLFLGLDQHLLQVNGEDCKLVPVLHVLQSQGCTPLTIPSFACVGKCSSYVQVSGSKMWQTERSCMCCQESGEREATVILNCPKAPSGLRSQKVITKAPVDCMCRPCTTIEEGSVTPQEVAGLVEDGTILSMIPPNLVQL